MERIQIRPSQLTLVALLLGSPVQAQQGLALAKQVCAQCHAVEKGATMSPNAAAPRFEVIANTPGMTTMALSAALQTSHRSMPNLILDTDQLDSIIAYIMSLKRVD